VKDSCSAPSIRRILIVLAQRKEGDQEQMQSALRIFVSALLTLAALLAADAATAQPHLEPTLLEDPTVPTPAQDVWLRRLVGNFKLDGAIKLGECVIEFKPTNNCATITGKIDCTAVGDGPGVQCVINAKWEIYGWHPLASSFLDPAMSLFGLDPGRSAINLLLINDRGLPTGGFGDVKGHFAAFKTRCPGANEDGCQVGIRIEAKPDANINYMWIGPNLVIAMHRLPPEEPSPAENPR
jgi:hypothetical protein